MVERGGRLGLMDEASLGGVVAGGHARQELQRDRTAEPDVEGVVDDPHPALADDRDEFVGPDSGARLDPYGWQVAYWSGSSSNFTSV
ncbi:MAG: hypothetical protein QF634_11405 [Vicinamibacterales bacterium]|jgi:hypothetical protein|nr:hypothetical protein [Vicinamibacterales bacterium]